VEGARPPRGWSEGPRYYGRHLAHADDRGRHEVQPAAEKKMVENLPLAVIFYGKEARIVFASEVLKWL